MIVVVDAGNSRIKWARADGGALADIGQAPLEAGARSGLDALEAAMASAAERIVAANVAGPEVAAQLESLADRLGAELSIVSPAARQFGVRCAYRDPRRLGADRWVGVVAAHLLLSGAACIVDAGTTVTLDVVTADGVHRGGLIMAGPSVVASALGRGTRGIGATTPAESAAAGLALLGVTTNAAVAHGTMLAIAAGVDRAVAEVAVALDEPMTVVLTGGGAPALKSWLGTEVSYRPHFILEGLARIAAEL